jgi:hypothetical protein
MRTSDLIRTPEAMVLVWFWFRSSLEGLSAGIRELLYRATLAGVIAPWGISAGRQ